jgi:hypothetical protein
MVSLSVDKSIEEPREFAKKNDVPWLQAYLGEWTKTGVPAQYGVAGIPAIFLVNPEGKIISTGLHGDLVGPKLEKYLQ